MNTLIIDIRENSLRAVLSNDGLLVYSRTFDFEPTPGTQGDDAVYDLHHSHTPAADNPYLLYYDIGQKQNPGDLAFKEIIGKIRSDINNAIDATHLIIPADDVVIATHQLPKMSRQDAEKLIGRKISAESREEFPPFSIIPSASDQKTQTWYSLYVPTTTLQDYRKAFAACRLRLTSITTPLNAMIEAFRNVREAIFNSYAVFEIQHGFVEAYYISADGLLLFQRLPYKTAANSPEGGAEDGEKSQKFKLFKIIDTIFRINSLYQSAHPQIPVQMAWVCGLESDLEAIATALNEAMGLEVGIAPAMPTGLPEESGYVPLAGFAAALQNGTAVSYSAADFFKRFPLRKTSGVAIYAATTLVALLAFGLTETEYRKLNNRAKRFPQHQNPKQTPGKKTAPAAHTRNPDSLRKLTARQFVFYILFRELANDLPDGVFLENLEFHLKDETGLVDITAVARLDNKIGESMLLSRLVAMLDRSPTLKNHREPSITVVDKDKERYLKITVTSEVNPLDKTK
ncbi:MAG: PilN domain-containing protein [Steroidobacteraceae bacterium]|nr:PilN domain-containing protein [Deltaproteobacteria bacterium]